MPNRCAAWRKRTSFRSWFRIVRNRKSLPAFDKEYRRKSKALVDALDLDGGLETETSLLPRVTTALGLARTLEGGIISFLKPAWWRLRSTLDRAYDFKAHQLKPSWSQVLTTLDSEYRAHAEVMAIETKAQETFDFHDPLNTLLEKVRELREASGKLPAFIREMQVRLFMKGQADQALVRAAELKAEVEQLNAEIAAFLDGCNDCPFAELREIFDQVEDSLDHLPDFLVCLNEAAGLPADLLSVLRDFPLTLAGIETAVAHNAPGTSFAESIAL